MPRKPIVIGHHIMWTLYGWWLPNDPRGSTSNVIRKDIIAELGELHQGRKEVQPASIELREFYAQARRVLQHPLLSFSVYEFDLVSGAIAQSVDELNYTCYACAVMPDHIHLLIRKHRDSAEEMIDRLQTLSRKRLVEMGLRCDDHPTWTNGGWKVFLDHPDEMNGTIRYIEQNPNKIGLLPQEWAWVVPYDNWPLHPGHSPNSPYVQALRAADRYPR